MVGRIQEFNHKGHEGTQRNNELPRIPKLNEAIAKH
jgi:hypothetical protein